MEIICSRVAQGDLKRIRATSQENPGAGTRLQLMLRNAVKQLPHYPNLLASEDAAGSRLNRPRVWG